MDTPITPIRPLLLRKFCGKCAKPVCRHMGYFKCHDCGWSGKVKT